MILLPLPPSPHYPPPSFLFFSVDWLKNKELIWSWILLIFLFKSLKLKRGLTESWKRRRRKKKKIWGIQEDSSKLCLGRIGFSKLDTLLLPVLRLAHAISYFKEFKNREKRIKIQFFLLIKEKRINFLCGVCLNFDNFFLSWSICCLKFILLYKILYLVFMSDGVRRL